MNITIWSDYACPYCYIGEIRLRKALDLLGLGPDDVKITYRAYELDPEAKRDLVIPTPDRLQRRYRLNPIQTQERIQHISDMGRLEGIDFNYAGSLYSNTRDAHRLMKLAEDRYGNATATGLNYVLFDAFFTRNLVLVDRLVLADLAAEVGMDRTEVLEMLESDRYTREVIDDETDARARGVTGVPFMLIDGTLSIPGAIATEDYVDAISSRLPSDKKAPVCNSDTCSL